MGGALCRPRMVIEVAGPSMATLIPRLLRADVRASATLAVERVLHCTGDRWEESIRLEAHALKRLPNRAVSPGRVCQRLRRGHRPQP